MTMQRQYYVELRNSSGTTIGTQMLAHGEFDVMRLASEAIRTTGPSLPQGADYQGDKGSCLGKRHT